MNFPDFSSSSRKLIHYLTAISEEAKLKMFYANYLHLHTYISFCEKETKLLTTHYSFTLSVIFELTKQISSLKKIKEAMRKI